MEPWWLLPMSVAMALAIGCERPRPGASPRAAAVSTGSATGPAPVSPVASTSAAPEAHRELPVGPAVELVASGVAGCDLAVDATYVYFVATAPHRQGGTLARLPKAGGTFEVLTPNANWIDDFALYQGSLFFAETVQGNLLELPLASRRSRVLVLEPPGLAPFPGLVTELVVEADRLLWDDVDDTLMAPTRGGSVLWLPNINRSVALAVDEAFVYFNDAGQLVRAPLPRASRPAEGNYPWPRRPGLRFAEPTVATPLAESGKIAPLALLLDGDSVFFAESRALGVVAKSGGARRTLLTLSDGEQFLTQRDQPLAVDATHLFAVAKTPERVGAVWREGEGQILRTAKDRPEFRELGRTRAPCGVLADGPFVYVATRHIADSYGEYGSLLRLENPK